MCVTLRCNTKRAYIASSAFGKRSRAVRDGADAGTYECGHLLKRMLDTDTASLFVHVPPNPTDEDIAVVRDAIELVKRVTSRPAWRKPGR